MVINLVDKLRETLKNALIKQLKIAETMLPADVIHALKNAYDNEENPIAKKLL